LVIVYYGTKEGLHAWHDEGGSPENPLEQHG